MRVITVRQPWAWAIIHGGKDVENRTRNIAGAYRGPVAIHVGLGLADDAIRSPLVAAAVGHLARNGLRGNERVVSRISEEDHPRNHVHRRFGHRGAIIGVVDLTDVHSASVIDGCGWMDNECPEHGVCRHHCSPWAMGPTETGWFQHLVLENPRSLTTPIPATGRLGLWKPTTDLSDQIQAAIDNHQPLKRLETKENTDD